MKKKIATVNQNEVAQRAADTFIEMAQSLEKEAKRFREYAKHYRSGELLVGYTNLPADAGEHMRHPAQRAIDVLSEWDIVATFKRLREELKGATS